MLSLHQQLKLKKVQEEISSFYRIMFVNNFFQKGIALMI